MKDPFVPAAVEAYLQRVLRPGQESALGGLPPQSWVAVSSKNPGIELGVERAKEVAGVHVLMGNY